MPTKSFFKSVNLNDKSLVAAFVSAVENASKKNGKQVSIDKTYEDVKGTKLDKLLDEFDGSNKCYDIQL